MRDCYNVKATGITNSDELRHYRHKRTCVDNCPRAGVSGTDTSGATRPGGFRRHTAIHSEKMLVLVEGGCWFKANNQ